MANNNVCEMILKAEEWWAKKNPGKMLVRHSEQWVVAYNEYYAKTTAKINFPPVGSGRKFVVHCDQSPYAGFDTYEEARAVANMYKSPGNPKRAMNACEGMTWTVRDMTNGATLYTAQSKRAERAA